MILQDNSTFEWTYSFSRDSTKIVNLTRCCGYIFQISRCWIKKKARRLKELEDFPRLRLCSAMYVKLYTHVILCTFVLCFSIGINSLNMIILDISRLDCYRMNSQHLNLTMRFLRNANAYWSVIL